MLAAEHNLTEEEQISTEISTGVTPKKAGIAWRRLCATLQQFGRQQERHLFVAMSSENRLLFRPHRDGCNVTLTLQGASVEREMGENRDSILFVKIRNNSVAYKMEGKLYSATRLALELFKQNRVNGLSTVKEESAVTKPSLARKQETPEQIVRALRQLNLLMARGASLADACKKAGIAESAYYRWRREYGGLDMRQAKWLTKLEKENAELKHLVAELNVLNQMLRGGTHARIHILSGERSAFPSIVLDKCP